MQKYHPISSTQGQLNNVNSFPFLNTASPTLQDSMAKPFPIESTSKSTIENTLKPFEKLPLMVNEGSSRSQESLTLENLNSNITVLKLKVSS